jgi:hypothetical protein
MVLDFFYLNWNDRYTYSYRNFFVEMEHFHVITFFETKEQV